MTTFYDNDLVEQWRTGKRSGSERSATKRPTAMGASGVQRSDRSELSDRERNIFNREFKSRLLANGAKESLLARKILIEMYVDRLNKHDSK